MSRLTGGVAGEGLLDSVEAELVQERGAVVGAVTERGTAQLNPPGLLNAATMGRRCSALPQVWQAAATVQRLASISVGSGS